MAHLVTWSPRAIEDVDSIAAYIWLKTRRRPARLRHGKLLRTPTGGRIERPHIGFLSVKASHGL